jgi:[acyl-carrier-protein] S-malonyltransferase
MSRFVTKLGFLFPGQGSQIVGMGKDFYDCFTTIKTLYETANEILGFKLTDISFKGPDEKLKQTLYTQPALYVHSYATANLLKERGLKAEAAAGHSLGEFSALAYAGSFSFEEGLKIVKERARLMYEAGKKEPGTMAAIIGLNAEDVMDICVEAQETGIVQPANYNSHQQIVISGSTEGVAKAMELAKGNGAKRVVQLPVSGAFHSPLMSYAVEDFGKKMDLVHFKMVKIPVYANVTAVAVSDPQEIRTLLQHQLTHPVRWVETIQSMMNDGVKHFIEVGAGKVLSGLVRRISRDVEVTNYGTLEEIEKLN